MYRNMFWRSSALDRLQHLVKKKSLGCMSINSGYRDPIWTVGLNIKAVAAKQFADSQR